MGCILPRYYDQDCADSATPDSLEVWSRCSAGGLRCSATVTSTRLSTRGLCVHVVRPHSRMGSLNLAQGSPKRLRNLYAAADRSFVHPAAVKKRVPYMDATAKQPLVISTPPCPVPLLPHGL